MIGELLEIGEQVIITVPKENREWGYNPAPDGTVGTIVGWGEIPYERFVGWHHMEPGIYENYAWAKVLLPNGETIDIGTWSLAPADRETYDRRNKERRDEQGVIIRRAKKLRDLPEDAFYPGDTVRFLRDDQQYVVQRPNRHGDTVLWYNISESFEAGWHMGAQVDQLELISRGNAWKYYHNLPLQFASGEDKVQFYTRLGHYTEVRNPANGLYKWTLDEALQAIRDRIGDGLTVASGFFGMKPMTGVVKFNDPEIGQLSADLTLKGFAR